MSRNLNGKLELVTESKFDLTQTMLSYEFLICMVILQIRMARHKCKFYACYISCLFLNASVHTTPARFVVFIALSCSVYCSDMTLYILHDMFVVLSQAMGLLMSYSLVICLSEKRALTFAFAYCQHSWQ